MARPAPSSTADQHPGAGYTSLCFPPELDDHQDWQQICEQVKVSPYQGIPSPDTLLERGLGDYTIVPNGILGKGKFSVVYRAEKAGIEYAIKHTPLYPHHPLIATRLLREPTLLAQLPPHPNLIRVFETIKTEGHFYLVEEYLPVSVSLDALCSTHQNDRLPLELCWKILQQLVSVAREGLHASRVCHRDIKPENVLVNPTTGDITLIDMGLATQFSDSSPKLTTCCGSPAFHSPEIVLALSRPPGEITYWGPELDIWCIALTVLRCWTGKRYPFGTTHKSLDVMRGRVQDLFAWITGELMSRVDEAKREEGRRLREWLWAFVDFDSGRRRGAFDRFDVGDEVRDRLIEFGKDRDFKQCTFNHCTPKYSLPLYFSPFLPLPNGLPNGDWPERNAPPSTSTLVVRNPTGQSSAKVVSFFKYALRCSNILYHCRSVSSRTLFSSPLSPTQALPSLASLHQAFYGENLPSTPPTKPDLDILQCVAVLPSVPTPSPVPKQSKRPFLPSLFRSHTTDPVRHPRSLSTPAGPKHPKNGTNAQGALEDPPRYLVFRMAFSFSDPQDSLATQEKRRRSQSRANGGRKSSGGTSRKRGSSRAKEDGTPRALADLPNSFELPLPKQDHPSWFNRNSSSSLSSGYSTPNMTPPLSPALEEKSTEFFDQRARSITPSTSRNPSRARHLEPPVSLSRQSSANRSCRHHSHRRRSPTIANEPHILIHVSDPEAIPLLKAAFALPTQGPSSPTSPLLQTTAPADHALSSSASSSAPSFHAVPRNPRQTYTPHATTTDDDDDDENEPPRGRSEARNSDSYPSASSQSESDTQLQITIRRPRVKTKSSETTPKGYRSPVANRGVPLPEVTREENASSDEEGMLMSPPPPQGQPLFPFGFRSGPSAGSTASSSSGPSSTNGDSQGSGFGGLFESMSLGIKGLGEAVVSVRSVVNDRNGRSPFERTLSLGSFDRGAV